MEMHPRVSMRRGVTAADVPAGQAQTQMHPPRADSPGNPRSRPHSELHRESFPDAGQPSRPHPFRSDALRIDRCRDHAPSRTYAERS